MIPKESYFSCNEVWYFITNSVLSFVNIISYWKVWKSVKCQLRETFYIVRIEYARWIFIKILKLRSDNTILSVNASRNRNTRHRRRGTYGITCICAIAVDKSVEKSSGKSRQMQVRARWQYLAHTYFPHIKIFLSILRNTTAFANRKSRHVSVQAFYSYFYKILLMFIRI